MRILSRKTLKDFWENNKYSNSEQPLKSWYAEMVKAKFNNMAELKRQYGTMSVLTSDKVVFNIGGNKFRLIVKIKFDMKIIFIKFIGTHKQYDNINAEEI